MNISETLKEKLHKSFFVQRFVGNVLFSEEEYHELLAYTSQNARAYAHGVNSYLHGDDEVHFVTLVEIAKRWKASDVDGDDDNGFWRFVWLVLDVAYGENKLYNAFTDIIKNGSLLKADTAKKYYATIMMHAFTPNKSMNAFFDFVYNIYKKDLDFDYTDADKNICNMATEGFCSIAQQLGGANVGVAIGSGVYGIKIGLRCMALGMETKQDFAELIHQVLTAINVLYHGEELCQTNYVLSLIKTWWDNKSDKDASEKREKREAATTKQNIVVKFIRRNDDVFLRIPSIRFASGESPILRLTVYDETDTILESRYMPTKIGEITVTSVQQDFALNELLNKAQTFCLRIEITENGKVIFNKTVKREFIIFDNEKEVTSSILKPNNYFVYSTFIDELHLPLAIYTIGKNLYNIYPIDGEMLGGSEKHIIFVESANTFKKTERIQLLGASGICTWTFNGTSHRIFSSEVILLISNDISSNSLELRINGSKMLLSSLTPMSENDYSVFDLTEKIIPFVSCNLSIYSHLKEKEVMNESIFFVPKLKISFSQQCYYGNDERQVQFSVGNQGKSLTWNLGNDELCYDFCKGMLKITIPQLKWRIDTGDWLFEQQPNVMWYKDFFHNGSVVEIESPVGTNNMKLYCLCDGETIEIPANTASQFEIGRYIYANEHKRRLCFFLKASINEKPIELCEVATKEHFLYEPPFEVNNNQLVFIGNECFIGSKHPYFQISLKRIGREVITLKSIELMNGILSKIDEGIYWIKISVPSNELFCRQDKTIWEGEFIFGDKEKLKLNNLIFKINPICGITKGNWQGYPSGYYISQLVRLDDEDSYSAKLYYQNSNHEQSDVSGFSDCKIVIHSPCALRLYVKSESGDFSVLLRGDSNGNIYGPQVEDKLEVKNYNYTEVKNV